MVLRFNLFDTPIHSIHTAILLAQGSMQTCRLADAPAETRWPGVEKVPPSVELYLSLIREQMLLELRMDPVSSALRKGGLQAVQEEWEKLCWYTLLHLAGFTDAPPVPGVVLCALIPLLSSPGGFDVPE